MWSVPCLLLLVALAPVALTYERAPAAGYGAAAADARRRPADPHRRREQARTRPNAGADAPRRRPSAEAPLLDGRFPSPDADRPGAAELSEELREDRTVTRQGKFLSLLTLVRFTNFVCNGTSGSNGTCYTAAQCSSLGGVDEGSCAEGYGVCCVIMKSCGETTNVNNTYFVNTNYPASYDGTGSCQLQITKASSNICQLRLDFDIFTIAQPETSNNLCLNDQFVVDAAAPVPSLCGTNTGNHMYIDAGVQGTDSPITLSIVTSGTSFARTWKIRVSQIHCNELYTAEPSCLQYHTGVSGKIQSFNFDFTNGNQLSNQDYAICVRMERNFCGIQYQPCTDAANGNTASFSLGGSTTAVNAVTGSSCSTDWLIIPCATDNVNTPLTTMSDGNVCVDRLCGDVFNTVSGSTTSAAAYSFTKPFRLYYHTDSQEADSSPAESDNRGFCLDYVQQPCTS
ncbi:uncharacterized protein LOC119102918 [Pollicipes pollicipes]|uniref:uncharacterized protein LOC119102918 n=1 Tax=Pollicipes pollicipes TaxID=41117 RepID=UPI0018850E3C|nr:uncharacterized protein LOC119102918 [Pollicipes pollicipes]